MDISETEKLTCSEAGGDGAMAHMFDVLTPREQLILGCLIFGARQKEISSRLSITPSSVGDRIKSIYKKLDIHNHIFLLYTAFGDAAKEDLEILDVLTPRRREVATLLLQGLTQGQIGRLKKITVPTVNDHIKDIFNTMGVHRMADLFLAVHIHARPAASPAASRLSSPLVPD